jgi:putative oxidoreductase
MEAAMPISHRLFNLGHEALGRFDRIGEFLPQLGLRLLLAYEFWQSGLEKWNGMNWFGEIMESFPFPFSVIPVEVSWQVSTWSELGGAVALVFGFATRFCSAALIVVTLVAWASVHAGLGYNVCDNGWKLPLIYLAMFLPLLFSGPGKLSLDHWIRLRGRRHPQSV